MNYQPEDAATEKGYAMKGEGSGVSFLEKAQSATIDLTADDVEGLRKKPALTWDSTKHRFQRNAVGADNKKKIRSESGVLVDASYKTDRWGCAWLCRVSWGCACGFGGDLSMVEDMRIHSSTPSTPHHTRTRTRIGSKTGSASPRSSCRGRGSGSSRNPAAAPLAPGRVGRTWARAGAPTATTASPPPPPTPRAPSASPCAGRRRAERVQVGKREAMVPPSARLVVLVVVGVPGQRARRTSGASSSPSPRSPRPGRRRRSDASRRAVTSLLAAREGVARREARPRSPRVEVPAASRNVPSPRASSSRRARAAASSLLVAVAVAPGGEWGGAVAHLATAISCSSPPLLNTRSPLPLLRSAPPPPPPPCDRAG